ncbi:hypothetical protein BD289DRAFT_253134 [Coniella lustricola]|uniref:Uncharacterized protein n=1 Tax=Coniella lustricola TaxID=2025994 RepID=A0A2T3A8D5_9PEZI|nr:hypothetical protein BD289DRAFT_253134 [Coniella lustricola]
MYTAQWHVRPANDTQRMHLRRSQGSDWIRGPKTLTDGLPWAFIGSGDRPRSRRLSTNRGSCFFFLFFFLLLTPQCGLPACTLYRKQARVYYDPNMGPAYPRCSLGLQASSNGEANVLSRCPVEEACDLPSDSVYPAARKRALKEVGVARKFDGGNLATMHSLLHDTAHRALKWKRPREGRSGQY